MGYFDLDTVIEHTNEHAWIFIVCYGEPLGLLNDLEALVIEVMEIIKKEIIFAGQLQERLG